MRHPLSSSTSSLHRIAAAAMSARSQPPFGGGRGRGRRNFSDRPWRGAGDNQNNPSVVSGDSHFNSVRRSNFAFQGFNNNHNTNINGGPQSFNSGYDNGGFQFQPGPRPSLRPPFNRRPKPADYRNWEFAKHPPPPHSERFVVLSYNILADYLANNHRKLYFHIPRRFMSWEWRKGNILFELGLWSPDIMCFQEVDKFQELEEELSHRGYSGFWKMRTGDPIDGCAIFWRTSRFKLVYEDCIEFNKLGMRDNVAQICVLESLIQNQAENKAASSTSLESPKRVVICNIHVLYNPKRGEIKLGQLRVLLERAQAISNTWDDVPVVLCGDFNCTPKSPLYNFISEQKLDISELGRDKISGQASAEICPPPRQSGNFAREQPTGSIAMPTPVHNNSVDSNQSDSFENQNASGSISENRPAANYLCQPQSDFSEKNVRSAIIVSTDDLKDRQSGCADQSTDEIASAKPDDQLIKKAEQDPELTSTKKNIRSCLLEKNHELRAVNSCQSDGACGTSSSESVEEDMLGSTSDMPPRSVVAEEASDPNTSSVSNYDIDEKLIGLSLDERDETLEDNGDLCEDAEEFLSKLNEEVVLEADAVDVDTPSYDPSLWTPMEIATATGNANITVLQHPLKLRSTFSEVEGSSRTRDSTGEPLVTSYNSCFMGTVDYIWRSEGLHTVKVLAPIPKDVMQHSGGFPTKKWGSDHIALASELAFTK